MTMILALLLASAFLRMAFSVSTSKYIRRHDNKVYAGTLLDTVVVLSTSHCATVCSRNDRCQVVNVCSRDGSLGRADCSLLGDGSFLARNLLGNNSVQGCFQMTKIQRDCDSPVTTTQATLVTTEPLGCENNGSLENGRCRCPIQYGGITCQRLIRDCSEPYENGHRAAYPGVTLRIQPAETSAPFWVLCVLNWAGMSYPLIRTGAVSFNVSWLTAKTWIGPNSPAINPYSDYFIGLENLHHLLKQADYQGNVYGWYDSYSAQGWVYYSKLSIGPENSSYALTYQSAWNSYEPRLDNGFTPATPLVFSTNDRDSVNCKKGYPGWFGSGCAGYSLFAYPMVWPVNGSSRTFNYLLMGVTRTSDFFVN